MEMDAAEGGVGVEVEVSAEGVERWQRAESGKSTESVTSKLAMATALIVALLTSRPSLVCEACEGPVPMVDTDVFEESGETRTTE